MSWTALLLAVAGVAVFVWSGSSELLDRSDKLFGVVGGLVAVVSAAVSVVTLWVSWRAAPAGIDHEVLRDRAARDLARSVERQWRQEATTRLLDRPEPLRVRWSSTCGPLAPTPAEVLGAGASGCDTPSLRLHGDVPELIDRYDQLPHRQMVVLGRPGAGKSVLVLLLMLGLLRRWSPGRPVPVLLTLSSWHPKREHLHTWLARRLVEEYPALGNHGRYGPDAVAGLVRGGALLPLLDGLDEMPQPLRTAAITGLNNAVGGGSPLVVTCRAEEYRAAVAMTGTTLGRAAVVEVEPVEATDAATYLPAGQFEGRRRWAPVVARLHADPHGPLAQALATPLMVYLSRTIYTSPDRDPGELCDSPGHTTPEQIENHLLDGYLPAVYAPTGAPPAAPEDRPATGYDYPADRARNWLTFVATRTADGNVRDFAWWRLPETIPRFGLLFGLVVGTTVGIAFTVGYGPVFGLALGLALAVSVGSATGRGRAAGPVAGLVAGLTGGLVAGVWEYSTDGLGVGLESAFELGVEAGFVAGLGIGLASWRGRPVSRRPRQVRLSVARLVRATARALPVGLGAGLLFGLVFEATYPANYVGLTTGLTFGLTLSLVFGISEAVVLPVDDQDATTPRSLLLSDRNATVVQVLAFMAAAGMSDALNTWLVARFTGESMDLAAFGYAARVGLTYGLAFGLAASVNSAWLRFAVARVWLASRGDLPWRLMRFLDDAHRRGVLRRAGGVYQFRHARLQDRLTRLTVGRTDLLPRPGNPVDTDPALGHHHGS
ncbi:hypothetical protein Pen02_34660 [Plantactinospora endophytica]|uniref:NACHT domain-containing protein n=1 Tax=Plantactinospora endophytica TaxID=673535 RepID=A0ABQ4E1I2_9ACTN|nr:hypothetical protein Pen02_34660 [Plantactinospora endophytica]